MLIPGLFKKHFQNICQAFASPPCSLNSVQHLTVFALRAAVERSVTHGQLLKSGWCLPSGKKGNRLQANKTTSESQTTPQDEKYFL